MTDIYNKPPSLLESAREIALAFLDGLVGVGLLVFFVGASMGIAFLIAYAGALGLQAAGVLT